MQYPIATSIARSISGPIVGSWWEAPEHLVDGVSPDLFAAPSLGLYMLNGNAVSPQDIFTLTSAAGKTYIDAAGVMQTAAANTARIDYRSGVGELLLEGSATNSLRNSEATGSTAGVFGSGGVAPTNWAVNNPGYTRELIGVFVENGITYSRWKFSGTPTGGPQTIAFETTTQVAALTGQTWTAYFRVRRVGATETNITLRRLQIQECNAGGTVLATGDTTFSLTETWQTITQTRTLNQATTAFVRHQIALSVNVGVATEVTIDIATPQLSQELTASSYIPTTGTAVTRTADTCTLTAVAYNVLAGAAGAVAARGVYPATAAASSRLVAYGGFHIVGPRAGSITQAENFNGTSAVYASAGSGTWATGFGAVGSWGVGARSIVLNGGTVTNDANGRGTQTQITIGPQTGMQAGQIVRLRQLVGWTLADRATAAHLQAQARLA